MTSMRQATFRPVQGETIGTSAGKLLGGLLIALVFVPLGAWLTWAWWTEASWLGLQLTSAAGLGGVAVLLMGLVGVPACILLLFVQGRLVLGDDRLQYVTRQGRVVTQVPYHNIQRMELTGAPDDRFIGIDLKDLADPETLNVGGESLKSYVGWHYQITQSGWLVPLEEVYQQFQQRIKQFRAR